MASIGGAPSGAAFPHGMGGAAAAVPQAPQGVPQTMHPVSSQSPTVIGRFQPLGSLFPSGSRGHRHGSAGRGSASSGGALGREIRGRENDRARDRRRDIDEPRLQTVSRTRQHSQLEMKADKNKIVVTTKC